MPQFFKVQYAVTFETVILVPDDSTPEDEAANIEIPEGSGSAYVHDTFIVKNTTPTDEPPTNH